MTWQKGQSGNPKGRVVGTKVALTERFLRTLAIDFKKHGITAIRECRERNPIEYLKVIAALVPKEAQIAGTVEHRHTDGRLSQTAAFLEGVFTVREDDALEESGETRPVLPH